MSIVQPAWPTGVVSVVTLAAGRCGATVAAGFDRLGAVPETRLAVATVGLGVASGGASGQTVRPVRPRSSGVVARG